MDLIIDLSWDRVNGESSSEEEWTEDGKKKATVEEEQDGDAEEQLKLRIKCSNVANLVIIISVRRRICASRSTDLDKEVNWFGEYRLRVI